MLINLERHEDIIEKNVERCRQKGIKLPTFREMMDPRLLMFVRQLLKICEKIYHGNHAGVGVTMRRRSNLLTL